MQFAITPHVGAGPVNFGMTIEQVRRALGARFTSFLKDTTSELPSDAFENEGVYVYYKSPGVCEAIELAKPASAVLGNAELFGPYDSVRHFIEMLAQIEEDGAGLVASELGISLYAPHAKKDAHLPVESVFIFEEGYYDR